MVKVKSFTPQRTYSSNVKKALVWLAIFISSFSQLNFIVVSADEVVVPDVAAPVIATPTDVPAPAAEPDPQPAASDDTVAVPAQDTTTPVEVAPIVDTAQTPSTGTTQPSLPASSGTVTVTGTANTINSAITGTASVTGAGGVVGIESTISGTTTVTGAGSVVSNLITGNTVLTSGVSAATENSGLFLITNSSGTQGAGGVIGVGSLAPIASGAAILPPKTVWIQAGTIMIDNQESSATLKKDDKLNLREIQMQETATVTGSVGVTIVIPQDTKIFAPEQTGSDASSDNIDTTVVIQTDAAPEDTGGISDPITSGSDVSSGVVGEDVIATGDQSPTSGSDDTAGSGDLSGLIEQIISSSFVGTVAADPMDNAPDPFAGQAPLQSDSLTIGNNVTDTALWPFSGWVTEKAFSFGIDNQHLVFTKPVEIHIDAGNIPDGTLVMLSVKHAGDTGFSSQGLSTDANATCDNMGNSSSESSMSTVQSGQVTFYTCGASAFALGFLDTMNPAPGSVSALVIQPDGAIVVGGGSLAGGTRNGVARYTSTGFLDPNYNPNLGGGVVNNLVVQSDGKVIAGGTFTTPVNKLVRLTSTGAVDTTFQGKIMDTNNVNALAMQSDGSVLVGGSISLVSGGNTTSVTRGHVARFSSSGFLDSFDPNVNSFVTALAEQSDGKVIIGGYFFSTIGGVPVNRLGRVTSTGLVDSGFKPDPDSPITAVAIQPNGDIVFGGSFTTVSGASIARNRIARVTITGLIDSTFNPNAGGQVQSLAVQPDGKIYVGGALFTTMGGRSRQNFARLNSDGSVDPTFDSAVNSAVYAISLDTVNPGVIIAGVFTLVQGQSKAGLARIGTEESLCGGFEGCNAWLKADTGVTASSSGLVSTWLSQGAYDSMSGRQTNGAVMPKYITGAMNFNPVIRFTSGNYLTMGSPYFFQYDNSEFAVFRTPHNSGAISALESSLIINPTACDKVMMLSGGKFVTSLADQKITSTINVNNNAPQIASLIYGTGYGQMLSLSGISNATGTTTGLKATLIPAAGMIIGNIGSNCVTNGAFSGDIAELISFNRRLTTSEANMVNSYLALKYGITLDQTTGHDYTLSGGITAWSRLSGGAYKYDISGIGRNDASSLKQYTGQTANSSGDIIVNFTGSLSDNQTLVRANDASTTGSLSSTGSVPAGYKRISRTWQFQEKNTAMSEVLISYYSGSVPTNGSSAVLYMFMNTGGTTLSGTDTAIYTGTLVGNTRQFLANPSDGSLMSFGYALPPPPATYSPSDYAWGALDPSFDPNANNTINALLMQSDGSIVLGGDFTAMGASLTTRNRIARVSSTGLLDSVFDPNAAGSVAALALMSNGSIVLGGSFTKVSGIVRNRVALVTSTGTLDSGFNANAGGAVTSLAIDASGYIVIGGSFTTMGGTARRRIARVTSTGLLDTTFPNLGLDATVSSIAIQSDGSIIFGGQFTSVSGTPRNGMARVSSTGVLDTVFDPNVPFGDVLSLAIQSDGSVIIAGNYSSVGGVSRGNLARVTSTGLLDTTYDPNPVGPYVQRVLLQSDGSLIIGGAFSSVGGMSRQNLARITSGGAVDTTFASDTNGAVNALVADPLTSSVIVGGAFNALGLRQTLRNAIGRIGLVPSICAGFAGCSTWLKADTGVTVLGSAVSGWLSQGVYTDVSGTQTLSLSQPTYITGAMNFNPVVRFVSGDSLLLQSDYMFTYDNSLFTVFRTSSNTGMLSALGSTASLNPSSCDRQLILTDGKINTSVAGESITSSINVNTKQPQLASLIYGTGYAQVLSLSGVSNATGTATALSSVPLTGLLIGNAGLPCTTNGAFSGDIAEIISFNRAVSKAEANMVNSYLALKYGITLDQTTGHDYTLSGGITAWSRLSGGAYNQDIAGIGRNDNSSFYQSKSRSSNNSGEITVEYAGTLLDNQTLVWGDDGGATGSLLVGYANNVPSGYQRIARTWKFQKKNTAMPSNINVSYYSGSLITNGTGVLYLFMNTGGTSLSGSSTTAYTGTLVGDLRTFTVPNPSDGALVTFGYVYTAPSGFLTISAPSSLAYTGMYVTLFTTQSATQYFANTTGDRFLVSDTIGDDSGYTTTLQFSGDLTTGTLSISSSNIGFKVSSTGVDLVSGSTNPRVVIDNAAINFQSLDVARNFILRNPASNSSVQGVYGGYLWLNTDMPGGQYPGAYNGTLVYTLIPN